VGQNQKVLLSAGGGFENLRGRREFQVGAKLTNLVNLVIKHVKQNRQSKQ